MSNQDIETALAAAAHHARMKTSRPPYLRADQNALVDLCREAIMSFCRVDRELNVDPRTHHVILLDANQKL